MTRRESNEETLLPVTTVSPSATKAHLVHSPWFLALALVIVTFVAYQPTWHAGFIWDDDDHLTANPAMTAPHGLRTIWSSLAVSRYYPLTLTSFWVQRRLWGLNPLPYHLVNVALHATNGVLVFLLLRRLRIRAAWLAAMAWALHPVNVESVAWITELKNVQSGLFFFLAVWCFLRVEAGARRGWYGLALVCGLAAMTSKPSTVVLPVALLLCVWWERGSWRRADLLRIAPFVALGLGMSVLTVVEQRGHIQKTGIEDWNLGMGQRVVLVGEAVWFYASKVLWPVRLTFVYPHWDLDAGRLLSWFPLAGLVVGGVLLWVWKRRGLARAGLFGCGFFVLSLLPVLGFFNVYYFRYSYVADHFQYLACIGLIALAIGAGETVFQSAGRLGRNLGTLVGVSVLLILGGATWRQAHIYQSPESVWSDTLAKNPQCWMAHNNLGAALALAGRLAEAKKQYEQSLRINPRNVDAQNNLGTLFWQEGKLGDAIECYQQALQINPAYAEAYNNLGVTLYQSGQREAAIEQYRQAVKSNPDYAEAHRNLGTALQEAGGIDEAITHFEQALRIKPDYAEAHYGLGITLRQAGRIEEAIGQYERALQIKPDYAEAHYSLGLASEKLGRTREAIEHYDQALRIKPDYAEAHNNLGSIFLQEGNLGNAIEQYQQALHIKPDYAEVHYNLGLALAQIGRLPEAVGHWEETLRLRPDYVDAHVALGAALEQTGQVPEAIKHYEQALRIKPDFAPARNALARLQASR
jgi:tetratricopeptide (TPR) repeat protein